MGKGPIIAGVVAVVAVLAIGAYMLAGRSSQNPAPGTTNSQNATDNSAAASLQNLMAMGQNQQCTFVDTNNGSEVAVYISSGNMRGDFTTVSDGQTVSGHTIIKGDDMYIWMDGETNGFKASMSASDALAAQMQPGAGNANSAVDLNQEVDYDCSPWSVDNTLFNLPSGVTFQDFSAMMPAGAGGQGAGSTETNTDAKALQCGACDSLPEDSAVSCRQALGC